MSGQQDILHGKLIAHRAEQVWGWSSHAGRLRAARRKTYLMQYGQPTRGSRILEIGCGTGVFTEALSRSGAAVVGFDISLDLLRQLTRKVFSPSLSVFVGDAARLPLPDRSFDLVVGISVLHHLDLRLAIAEIKRVLTPGGRIVFTEPNMLNPQILVQKNIPVIKRWLGDTMDETAFFRWSLARFLTREAFTDVRVIPFDFLHPWTPRWLIPAVHALGETLEAVPLLREVAGSLLVTGARPEGVV